MDHLLGKTQHHRTPEYPERAATENADRRDVLDHMHQTQTVYTDHSDQQRTHKTETAVNQELRQVSTGQA